MEDIGSCSNWRKGSKVAKYSNGGVDRISDLPDKMLAHMLSFLPTKNSVGTSVLSHRWRYLFTLVSKFDFDEHVFFNKKNDPNTVLYKERFACRRAGVKCPSIFKDFVDRVLLVCNSPHISSFRLSCGLGFDCSNVDVWIRFALIRGVTELDIFTYEDDCFLLPSLFSSETLVVLKLHGYFEMKFPASFKLPKLKTLQLSTVEFDDDNSLNRLLSGCPLLEDLELLGGGWEKLEDINISSPKNHFHFEKNTNAFWEIANLFSGAKVLFFGGLSIEAVLGGDTKLPTFNNLTRLELGCARYILWRFTLPNLLNSTPNLETLVFPRGLLERKPDENFEDKTFWSKQRKAPPCVSRIKLIEITCFLGFDEELQMARYFLRHGKGLRKLVLDWMMSTKEHWKDFSKLKKLADSKGCMITGLKLWPAGDEMDSKLYQCF